MRFYVIAVIMEKMLTLRGLFLALFFCVAGAAQAGSIWDTMEVPSTVSGDGPPAGILDPDAKQGFSGSVALGYIGSSGNAETSSVNADLELNYTSGSWFHDLSLNAQRASSGHETTVDRLDFDGQSSYLFSKHNYLFLHASYQRKAFGGFDRRTSEAFGYGRRILGSGKQTLDFEGGIGARQTHLGDGGKRTSGIVRIGGRYQWQFSDNGSFGQAIAIEAGSDNTYTASVTSLRANLMAALAVIISYTIKHNSRVPDADIVNTDTYTTISLQYSF